MRAPAGRRKRRGATSAVAFGATVAVLAAAVLIIVGTGNGQSLVKVRDTGAWLLNRDRNELVHVDGMTGRTDRRVLYRNADGEDLEVIYAPDGVYVRNRRTGRVSRLDETIGKPTAGREIDNGARLIVGVGWAYVVKSRDIQRIDPFSLEPAGDPIKAEEDVGDAVIDDDGTLWAAVPRTGDVLVVRDGRRDRTFKGGRPDEQQQLSVTAGRPAVTNESSRDARRARLGGLDDPALLDAAGEIRVATRLESSVLYVGVGRSVVRIDPDTRERVGWPLPTEQDNLGDPLPNGDRVYVQNRAEHKLHVLDARSGASIDDIDLSEYGDDPEIFVRNGFVWINNQQGQNALVIDKTGKSKTVTDKFRDDLPTTDDQPGSPTVEPPPPADEPVPDQQPQAPTPRATPSRYDTPPTATPIEIPPVTLPPGVDSTVPPVTPSTRDTVPPTVTVPPSSTTTSTAPPPPTPPPDPPASVSSRCNGTSAELTWSASPNAPQASYVVTVAGQPQNVPSAANGRYALSIAGRASYSVVAVDGSQRSSVVTGTSPDCSTPPPRAPGQPAGLTDSCAGGSARVTWSPPADQGSDAITGYDITYRTTNGTSNTSVTTTTFTSPSSDAGGAVVSVDVRARNSAGPGASASVNHLSCVAWNGAICTIRGTDLGEVLDGTDGDDVICGFGGDDTITPGRGSDTIDGGTGTDMISYADYNDGSGLGLGISLKYQNSYPISRNGDTSYFTSIENASGSPFGDAIAGNEFSGRSGEQLFGLGGNDDINGYNTAVLVNGGPGDDWCYSSSATVIDCGRSSLNHPAEAQ